MGRYTDGLEHRLRARQVAHGIKHPRGAGVVMWCSSCRAEMLRMPAGKAPTMRQQKAAVAAHRRVCQVKHLTPSQQLMRRRINRAHQWAPMRYAWRRWRWRTLAVAAAILTVVAWLL